MSGYSKRYMARLNQAKVDLINWSSQFHLRRFLRYRHSFWWLIIFVELIKFVYNFEK